jgi:hypothetical protein
MIIIEHGIICFETPLVLHLLFAFAFASASVGW